MADEKVAVVTGSSSGIGLLTAVELALNGYRVVATMRNLDNRGRLEEAAQKAGVRDRLDLRRLDITDFDSLAEAVDAIVRDHGRIDVLVNNAGFSSAGFVEDMQLARNSRSTGNQLLRQRRHDQSRAAGDAQAEVGAHHTSDFGRWTRGAAHDRQLRRLEICAGRMERGAAHRSPLAGHSGGAGRARFVRHRHLGTQREGISQARFDPASPNRERSQRFAEFVKNTAKNRRDAREVAKLIVRIAQDPNPKLRYLIGR